MKVGRNDPCPCGSGKKYKKCCLAGEQSMAEDQRLYRLLLDLTDQVVRFAQRRYGTDVVDEGWRDFWGEEPPEHWDGSTLFDLFSGWFVFHWIPKDRRGNDADSWPQPGTLAAQFQEHDRTLGPVEQRLLTEARREPLSFWEIESADGEGRVQLRDIILGRYREAWLPPSSHRWLEPDHVLLAQVIPVDGEHILGALSSLPLPVDIWGDPIRQACGVLREHGVQSSQDLLRWDMFALRCYQRFVKIVLDPQFTNTDGENVAFTWSVYTFEPARRAELMGQLRSMRNFHYLGDSVDPFGSGEDGEQLALNPQIIGPAGSGEEERWGSGSAELEEKEIMAAEDGLLPFPEMPRAAGEEEDGNDRTAPSEEIERWLDPEATGPSAEHPAFVWRIKRREGPVPGTTMARIEVEADRVVTVANSAQRNRRLRQRLLRNVGHILTCMGSIEQPIWEMAGAFGGKT